ncbi:hypothetical protein HDU98_010947, partial [Podochytrium sp. JEL0797]
MVHPNPKFLSAWPAKPGSAATHTSLTGGKWHVSSEKMGTFFREYVEDAQGGTPPNQGGTPLNQGGTPPNPLLHQPVQLASAAPQLPQLFLTERVLKGTGHCFFGDYDFAHDEAGRQWTERDWHHWYGRIHKALVGALGGFHPPTPPEEEPCAPEGGLGGVPPLLLSVRLGKIHMHCPTLIVMPGSSEVAMLHAACRAALEREFACEYAPSDFDTICDTRVTGLRMLGSLKPPEKDKDPAWVGGFHPPAPGGEAGVGYAALAGSGEGGFGGLSPPIHKYYRAWKKGSDGESGSFVDIYDPNVPLEEAAALLGEYSILNWRGLPLWQADAATLAAYVSSSSSGAMNKKKAARAARARGAGGAAGGFPPSKKIKSCVGGGGGGDLDSPLDSERSREASAALLDFVNREFRLRGLAKELKFIDETEPERGWCIPLDLKYCEFTNPPREHNSNRQYMIVDLSRGHVIQKCHSQACRDHKSDPVTLPDELRLALEQYATSSSSTSSTSSSPSSPSSPTTSSSTLSERRSEEEIAAAHAAALTDAVKEERMAHQNELFPGSAATDCTIDIEAKTLSGEVLEINVAADAFTRALHEKHGSCKGALTATTCAEGSCIKCVKCAFRYPVRPESLIPIDKSFPALKQYFQITFNITNNTNCGTVYTNSNNTYTTTTTTADANESTMFKTEVVFDEDVELNQ